MPLPPCAHFANSTIVHSPKTGLLWLAMSRHIIVQVKRVLAFLSADTGRVGLQTKFLVMSRNTFPSVSASTFAHHASEMMRCTPGLSQVVQERRFRALFGISAAVCAKAWDLIVDDLPHGASPVHLLWSLLFLKVYASEHNNHLITGADEKTFRKWTWIFLERLADMSVVRNRPLETHLSSSAMHGAHKY